MKLKTFNTVKFVVSMSTSMKMPIKNYMKKICKNTLELRFFAKFHLFQKVFILFASYLHSLSITRIHFAENKHKYFRNE